MEKLRSVVDFLVNVHTLILMYSALQLVENIRGSGKSSAQSHTKTHSIGAKIGLSKEGWRVRIRQAWLAGLLERSMRVGKGHNLMGKMVFNTFQLADKGLSYLQSPHSLILPPAAVVNHTSANNQNSGRYTQMVYLCRLNTYTYAVPLMAYL